MGISMIKKKNTKSKTRKAAGLLTLIIFIVVIVSTIGGNHKLNVDGEKVAENILFKH